MNKLNIEVECNGEAKMFTFSTRREMFNAICKYFHVTKEVIQLFDKEQKKIITINDLLNNMKVEIKKLRENGQIQESKITEEIKVPDRNHLLGKLRENKVLTGFERRFIVENINLLFEETENPKRKYEEKLNKGVQVFSFKDANCQTEYLQVSSYISETPSSNKRRSSRRIVTRNKGVKRNYMQETFPARRNFILMENPEVKFLKRKYPHLFTVAEVRNELNRIFYLGKDNEFISNIEKMADIILSLIEEDPILESVQSVETNKQYAREVGALLLLSNLLNEQRFYLHTKDEKLPENSYPYIEAKCKFEELWQDNHVFYVVVEGITACKTDNFKEAVLCLVACYFIFNISYLENIFSTLVAMEKLFLKAPNTPNDEIDNHTEQVIKLIHLKLNRSKPKVSA